MKYMLDTCTVSYFAKGDIQVAARIKATSPALLAISSIAAMEIEFGLQLNAERVKILAPIMSALVDSIQVLPYSLADARAAAASQLVLMTCCWRVAL